MKTKQEWIELLKTDIQKFNDERDKEYEKGNYLIDFRNADLRSADLRNADLRSADLRSADFRNANLSGSDLRNANLRNANLSGSDLRNADLRSADLRYANLSGSDLRNANLRNANLSGSDLDYTNVDFACRTLNIKHDERLLYQRIYHLCAANCTAKDFPKIKKFLKKYANKFHRVDECGKIE